MITGFLKFLTDLDQYGCGKPFNSHLIYQMKKTGLSEKQITRHYK